MQKTSFQGLLKDSFVKENVPSRAPEGFGSFQDSFRNSFLGLQGLRALWASISSIGLWWFKGFRVQSLHEEPQSPKH